MAEDTLKQSEDSPDVTLQDWINIAYSRRDSISGKINDLHNPTLFAVKIRARAFRFHSENPTEGASMIATVIQNHYMLASAWNLISQTMQDLAEDHLVLNTGMVTRLENDADFRLRYLKLHGTIKFVADACQDRFASLVADTPDHSQQNQTEYFSERIDWENIMESTSSRRILRQVLDRASMEQSNDDERFPQIHRPISGDLSAIRLLQEHLERPFSGERDNAWKEELPEKPKYLEDWINVQRLSERALKHCAEQQFQDSVHPLEKTQSKESLDEMWASIDRFYQTESGRGLDDLWQVADIKRVSLEDDVRPKLGAGKGDDGSKAIGKDKGKEKENEDEDDNDNESNSDAVDDFSDDEDDRRSTISMLEALEKEKDRTKFHALVQKLSNNKFLKKLGSLRHRQSHTIETTNHIESKYDTTTVADSARGVFAQNSDAGAPASEKLSDLAAAAADAVKKGKKRFMSAAAKTQPTELHGTSFASTSTPELPRSSVYTSVTSRASTSSLVLHHDPSLGVSSWNQSSLSIASQETAKSAHKYLQDEGLAAVKAKVKTRANHGNHQPVPETLIQEQERVERPGKRVQPMPIKAPSKAARQYYCQLFGIPDPEGDARINAPLKWSRFLRVMTDLGFEIDGTAEGASVKFVPPHDWYEPIAFHRPHPDPTINPELLPIYRKRLREHYGWSTQDLVNALQ
ncbi:hypothetical protein WOLCODRAFT_138329 [Wolfiporia cocos MD-104 SS10]|uniref:Uncharacterized protein n=1 Tax=Wolfiporia cocos (strain MD-104) TaxID=742152 RepID=A0A2H3JTY1_WOLCO|nr:hypothetical protein WOLCODRAFT_138329 [Wolfiporia cocos MD-104 SS10]